MTDTPNRLSLWQAMDSGMDAQANKEAGQTDPLVWRRIRAAEIRALRDWILAELETAEGDGWLQPNLIELPDLEALLTTEADRAEQNDNT
jgi:hypothetical protein